MGVEQSFEQAAEWFLKSAMQGNAHAQFGLGFIYYIGNEGFEQDYSKALPWFQAARAQNHSKAQFWLGHMYMSGEGVEKNVPTGIKLLTVSANNGYSDAMMVLASVYNDNNIDHTPLSDAEAADLGHTWLLRAAEAGNAKAIEMVKSIPVETA